VLTDAQVNKITFDRHHEHIHASGVDFTSLGREYHVEAEHEILLCAGSFQSPQILELSGIGSKSILEKLEIDCIVDNPNVGENLQDHGFVPLSFQAAEGITTYDSITNNLDAAKEEYFANRSGLLTALFNSNANLSYEQVASRTEHISSEPIADSVKAAVIDAIPSLKKQYKLLGESLLNPENSSYQIIYIPIGTQKGFVGGEAPPSPGNFITIDISIERPYSRGRVHISSKDPAVAPKIDPNYLSHPLDLEIFRNGLFFVQDLAKTEPFSNFLKDDGNAFHPGFFHLTRENIDQFCREALTSEFHPLGTCSMMPERDGGVVDTHLRVYGVRGLRVVDASVMPMEIRNNIQSAVYAVAEKAADIIKADWKEKFGDGEELRNGAKRGLEYESEGRQNGKRSRRY
jgi:choline dehydrogenase